MQIDLNCDLGESFGLFKVGADEDILSLVSSANVACGLHAGDFSVMAHTVDIALANGVAIGAHPGLPDLQGFGRHWIPYTPREIYNMVLYQIGALSSFVTVKGAKLNHVKPHGALYNKAAVDREVAEAVVRAVRDFSPELKLFALSGSILLEVGRAAGLKTVSEVFADRQYQADGTLVPRTHPEAMMHSTEEMATRLLRMVETGSLQSLDGQTINLQAETVCLHGDEPEALEHARELRKALEERKIVIKAW